MFNHGSAFETNILFKGPPHTRGKFCIQVYSSKLLKDMEF